MCEVKLGQIIDGSMQRDAVHIAIAPVVATQVLKPGQDIGFVEIGDTQRVGVASTPIGIVDPFLKQEVQAGQQFWMFLYPNTILGLRHDWTHPAFGRFDSKKWLEKFASEVELTLDELIAAAKQFIATGDDYCLGFETPEIVWEESTNFWKHFEIFTGMTVSGRTKAETFFRCAC